MFLGQHQNKMDKKGRISVPASFRASLAPEGGTSVIVYPSFKNDCLEACSVSRMQEIAEIINELDPYSAERDAFETVVFGAASEIHLDSEGRILVPSHLISHAALEGAVSFVGKGKIFEIWSPNGFAAHLQNSQKIAKDNRLLLKINKK